MTDNQQRARMLLRALPYGASITELTEAIAAFGDEAEDRGYRGGWIDALSRSPREPEEAR